MEERTFKTKILLKDTLRDMSIGSELIIPNRIFKVNTIRTATAVLKKDEGYSFEVSDKDRIDDTIVTRIK